MVINNRLFPYPVLADDSDDYKEGLFTVSAAIEEETLKELKIKFNISLDNRKLQELINKNKAEYMIHVECPYTSYRDMITTSSDVVGYLLPKDRVNVRVEIVVMLVAKQAIHYYRNALLDSDYDNIDIHIPKGAILAYYNIDPLMINKRYEELSSSDAIFTVCKYDRKSQNEHNPIRFDLTDERIKITVDDDIYMTFSHLDKIVMKPVLMSSLVYPALIYMLETMRQPESDAIDRYQNSVWFKQLDKMYRKTGKDFIEDIIFDETQSITKIAQEILDNPITDLYININNMFER